MAEKQEANRATRHTLAELVLDSSPHEWVIACTVLLFVIQYAILPRLLFFSPDEGIRIIASRSLRADSLLTGLVDYPSRWIDPLLRYVPYYRTWFTVVAGYQLHFTYSHVLFGALIAPFDRVGGVSLVQAFPILCGALSGLCAAAILIRTTSRGAAIIGVITVMLILPSALYSFLVWEHQLALALVLLALWFYLKYQDKAKRKWLALGIGSALLACALRIEIIFVLGPALVWITWCHARARHRAQAIRTHAIPLSLAVVAVVLVLGSLYLVFSRYVPYRFPQLNLDFSPQRLRKALDDILYLLIGYGASPATVFGILLTLVGGNFALRFRRLAGRAVMAGTLMVAASITVLSLLGIGTFKLVNPGLLGAAPLLALALLVQPAPVHPNLIFLRRSLWTVIAAYCVGTLLFPALAALPAGVMAQTASTWASRYFLLLYPLSALVALSTVSGWLMDCNPHVRKWLQIAVAAAVVAGVLGNLVGLLRIADRKAAIAAACQPIWESGLRLAITDDWWRAAECAAHGEQTYLYVPDTSVLPGLRQSLWNNGIDQFMYASRDSVLPLSAVLSDISACYDEQLLNPQGTRANGIMTRIMLHRKAVDCS